MADRVGQRFGSYRLTRPLGQGGFAEVYLGQHIYLDTLAAIKVLHARMDEEDVENFRKEAYTIGHLVHPHIVRVLEFNVEDTVPYLVVDYAPNGTLRKRHPRGTQVPVPTVVSYVLQVASALQYAHDQKIIHRDVKPENMLLGRRDEVLLSDFGIALVTQSSRSQSTQGIQEMAGTIAYMAPEQIQSRALPASDQYSLAVVAYEWLCGSRPFHGVFAEIAVKHTLAPPPSLCAQVADLPKEIEDVILKTLSKDPQQRYPSVTAFAEALEAAWLHSRPFHIPTSDISPDAARRTSILLPIATSSISLPPVTSSLLQEVALEAAGTVAEPGSIATSPLSPETEGPLRSISRRRLLFGLLGITAAGIVGGGITLLLSRTETTPGSTSLLQRGNALYTYTGHSDKVWSAAWSPVEARVASASSDNTVQVWNAMTGDHRTIYRGHSDAVYGLAWSPDGRRIASASYDNTVQIWDAAFGDYFFTYRGHSSWVWTAAWSPDGQHIASGGNDMEVHVWNAADGSHARILKGHTAPVYGLAWSPDGKYLASTGGDGTVHVWSIASNSPRFTYQQGTDPLWSVGWSPDGRRIASAGDDTTVQLWDALSGQHLYVYHGHTDFVYSAAWSPNGGRIASGSSDKSAQLWDALDGANVYTYNGHTDAVRSVSWSRDSKYVASASWDTTVQVWQAK